MRVLGIDPGTWATGVGLVENQRGKMECLHYETLLLRGRAGATNLPKRLKKLYDSLNEILKVYQPDVMALEDVFFGLDFSAAVRIGEARAMAILAATHFDIEVAEYAPTHIKKSVAGNGRASKVQIQYMVRQLLKLKENPPPDAADALAVAICHCHYAGRPSGLLARRDRPAKIPSLLQRNLGKWAGRPAPSARTGVHV